MRELFAMWSNTRMVVLTAICAALYAAILIPFKVVPLIPGITEFRPANAVPVVCSFLFGPAAAWGAAFGNLIGDFFGGLGPGDLFGFFANLLYGLVPCLVWEALTDADPVPPRPAVSRPGRRPAPGRGRSRSASGWCRPSASRWRGSRCCDGARGRGPRARLHLCRRRAGGARKRRSRAPPGCARGGDGCDRG